MIKNNISLELGLRVSLNSHSNNNKATRIKPLTKNYPHASKILNCSVTWNNLAVHALPDGGGRRGGGEGIEVLRLQLFAC